MKIAYVEDDKDSATIFSGKLRADGIACDLYADAEGALSTINPGLYDILVIDIRLPKTSGTELLQKLRAKQVHTPCILITAFNSLDYAREAFGSSANYLLEKPFSYKALRRIMDKVFEGPGTLQNCVDRGLARLHLTEREQQTARYLLKGLSNAEIARVISISEKTVKQYMTQIFEKADVAGRAEFFSYIFPV